LFVLTSANYGLKPLSKKDSDKLEPMTDWDWGRMAFYDCLVDEMPMEMMIVALEEFDSGKEFDDHIQLMLRFLELVQPNSGNLP